MEATQQELYAKIVAFLQAASAERDVGQRIRLLQQAQELLLRADAQVDTVNSCLDFFLNLQAQENVALRRYGAYFLERVLFLKPALAMRCVSVIGALLGDSDALVQELAVKAAITLHGRVLLLLSLERDALQFHKHHEQFHQVQESVKKLLQDGCPNRAALFTLAARWAKVLVLAQSPSPLALRVRVPPELRGVGCLQDFPEKATQHLDLNVVRQQAIDLFDLLCRLIRQPPGGSWEPSHLRALLQCTSSIARQRPEFLNQMREVWFELLKDAAAVLDGQAPKAALPVPVADTSSLQQMIRNETQRLLASSITAEKHGELVEILHASGWDGSLEDLATQAKYEQICAVEEKSTIDGRNGEPKTKRSRKNEIRRVWAAGKENVLADEDAFDADALYSGEAETACRRFEDYFGLPSQREPAGHVSGPALLASRIGSSSELARIALTSLSSLSMKRNILRDRIHEKAVAFHEPPVRDQAGRTRGGVKAGGDAPDLALFLSGSGAPDGSAEPSGSEEATLKSDPRSAPASKLLALPAPAPGNDDAEELSLQLPSDMSAKEGLQLRLFKEVLEAQRRMDKSLLRASMSVQQIATFDLVSRQVALHLAAAMKSSVSPNLQRAMFRAFMQQAFDALKTSLETSKPTTPGQPNKTGSAALGKLVELFYAKFSTDIARWQEQTGHAKKPAALAAAKTPLQEILEGGRGADKNRALFTYAELFELFVAEFERCELPKRELRTFLNEIPVVPNTAFKMLASQCQQAATRKMALLTILSLIEGKPACRWQGLQLLFTLAYFGGEDSSIRFDTIRLIINKIYDSTGPHQPMRWQLPHLVDEEAKQQHGQGADEIGTGWELPADDFVPLQRVKGRCVEDVATLMLRSMAPSSAKFAFPVNVPLRVEQLRVDLFKGIVCASKDRVWLYLALCIKRPVLLHSLVETFTACDSEMREHLVNSIEEAIKYIPASERELLVLVQRATPETERLVLKVLYILMQTRKEKEGLSPEYGEAVTRLYSVTQNPKLLVPVFDLLDRRHLLDFLPAVLQLEADEVTNAFQQLTRSRAPPLSIPELLTELHHMNNPSENIVPIKFSMQALNIVFGMREKFDTKVYGIVIQALVEEPGPLPTLFMRTVIQVVKELPRLSDFVVMEILPRLVRQEVWGDENMWRGFMIVLQHTFSSSSGGAARVLAMLPMSQLEDVLVQHPDWKAQLREFVARQPAGAMPPHVRQLLQ